MSRRVRLLGVDQGRLGVDPDEINGGHYISLSCPLELAARLAAYAAKTH